MIFVIDRDRLRDWSRSRITRTIREKKEELNGSETAESVFAKRARMQKCAVHVGYHATGSSRHHPEDAVITRCRLHGSSDLQVEIPVDSAQINVRGCFKNYGEIWLELSRNVYSFECCIINS